MLYANNNQPITKHRPPIGVIAPNHLKSVKTKIIRVPEKITVPKIKKYDGSWIKLSGKWKPDIPININPRAWYNWYRTAVSKIAKYSRDNRVLSPWAPKAPNKTDKAAIIDPATIKFFI